MSGVLMYGVLMSGVLMSGVLMSGVLMSGVLMSGVLMSGVFKFGVLMFGVLRSGVLMSGVLMSGVLEPESSSPQSKSKPFTEAFRLDNTYFWSKQLAFIICGGVCKHSWPSVTHTFFLSSVHCFSPTLGVPRKLNLSRHSYFNVLS